MLSFQDTFSIALLHWFNQHGRHDLPWKHPKTPYRIWVSEIMLQQTQVQTVIPYFERFMEKFPSLTALANADESSVLAAWAGLGYYARGRNLLKTAKIIVENGGTFPTTAKALQKLPGIGASTAAAISSQCFNEAAPILDGNVIRVLTRVFAITGLPKETQTKKKLWEVAKICMPTVRTADYTQAIMDLGATCCTASNPGCTRCPLNQICVAYIENKIAAYPEKPKIKPIRPIKTALFLFIYDPTTQQVFLEKRPSKGLWGGLWSLPEIAITEDPIDFLWKNYSMNISKTTHILEFTHQFTHFQLNITANAYYIESINQKTYDEKNKWHANHDLIHLAFPKPISKIIETFFRKNF